MLDHALLIGLSVRAMLQIALIKFKFDIKLINCYPNVWNSKDIEK